MTDSIDFFHQLDGQLKSLQNTKITPHEIGEERFLFELKRFRVRLPYDKEYVNDYLKTTFEALKEQETHNPQKSQTTGKKLSTSPLSLEYLNRLFGLTKEDLYNHWGVEGASEPLDIEKFHQSVAYMQTMIDILGPGPAAHVCGEFLLHNVFHEFSSEEAQGICGNSASDFYYENMCWSLIQTFVFFHKNNINITSDILVRKEEQLIDIFTDNWIYCLSDEESSIRYQSLGENLLSIWLSNAYGGNVDKIKEFQKNFEKEDYTQSTYEKLAPIFEKVILQLQISPVDSDKPRQNFKI